VIERNSKRLKIHGDAAASGISSCGQEKTGYGEGRPTVVEWMLVASLLESIYLPGLHFEIETNEVGLSQAFNATHLAQPQIPHSTSSKRCLSLLFLYSLN